MRNVCYSYEYFTKEWKYAGHYLNEDMTVDGAIKQLSEVEQNLLQKGAKLLLDKRWQKLYEMHDGYILIGWHYYQPGYGNPDNFLEHMWFWYTWCISNSFGWSSIRCKLARTIGLDWQAGHKWIHRRNN